MSVMHPLTMFLVVVLLLNLLEHELPMYDGLVMLFSQTAIACCSVIPPGVGHVV